MELKLVLTTVPNRRKAEEIAHTMVESCLAACVQLLPGISSTYAWEGKIVTEEECLILFKTSAERVPSLKEALLKLHPYTTPEFVVLDSSQVDQKYLAWAKAALS